LNEVTKNQKEVRSNTQEITNDCALSRIVGPDRIRYRLKAEKAQGKNTEPVVGGFGVGCCHIIN
jgi:hypothetical protein